MSVTAPALRPEAVRARARAENFSVASLLVGPRTRAHLLAVYDFARLIDQLGDDSPGDRIAALAAAERELARAFEGTARTPVFRVLTQTIRVCNLEFEPFLRLIEANRRDQDEVDYLTFAELLGYCELSANPVGELVLAIFGAATPERVAWSNDVCTALQIVEHLQDVGEDAARGRVYLPREDRHRFGVSDAALRTAAASDSLRQLVAWEAERARRLLDSGTELVHSLRGRARLAVAGYVGGGRAALAEIEALDHDVLAYRTVPTRAQKALATLAVLKEAL